VKETTASREVPIFDSYPNSDDESTPSLANDLSLTITSMPQGRFMYWKGFRPAELLDDPRLVAYIKDLPFQQSRSLPQIEEEGAVDVVLVDYSDSHELHLDR
jgi:hypothetical protein